VQDQFIIIVTSRFTFGAFFIRDRDWGRVMSADSFDYDLLVIGSGPAGQRAAIQGAKLDKKVAIVERKTVIGGCSVNLGTIPSKTLREAALSIPLFDWGRSFRRPDLSPHPSARAAEVKEGRRSARDSAPCP
jgi:cation diffusion facilitator CzcD-associated flavoprotein CzcO